LNKTLRFLGQITKSHLKSEKVKHPHIFIIDCMNISQLVFFRLEEHLDNNPIKTTNLRHIIRLFSKCKITHYFPIIKKSDKKRVPAAVARALFCFSRAAETARNKG